jgi:hypothetical protein
LSNEVRHMSSVSLALWTFQSFDDKNEKTN